MFTDSKNGSEHTFQGTTFLLITISIPKHQSQLKKSVLALGLQVDCRVSGWKQQERRELGRRGYVWEQGPIGLQRDLRWEGEKV